MPLKSGKSRQVFSANVKELVKSGRPLKQALAIAYSKKRSFGKGKKKKMLSTDLSSTRGTMAATPLSYAERTATGPMAQTMMRKSKSKKMKKYGKKMKMEKNSLYRNIRVKGMMNRITGAKPKKPTKAMLAQEKKIKMEEKMSKKMGKKMKKMTSKPAKKMILKKKMGKVCKKCSKKMTKGTCPMCK